ncbi:uncharacterized protein [Epargyreus clarus]|uniref:uncharacterized protein n=1 Tax=Epargyreus clarus TaxID=520877 RepID=UPI003C2CAE67
MSEQEKKGSGGATKGSAIVMVDQTSATVKPCRPTEIQDSDVHHKRTRAPAVPSVAEELKNLAEGTTRSVDSSGLKDNERAMSSEHKVSKKSSKRRDSSPDIRLAPIGVDPTKDNAASKTLQQSTPSPTQPIPPQIPEETSEASVLQLTKEAEEKNTEEDSIMEEVTELQTIEDSKKHSEWSDDEEAGGLPRSESRASRVSRAVRQLFCCGVRYEAASEDNISTRSGLNHGI